jgi:hypothetical protein
MCSSLPVLRCESERNRVNAMLRCSAETPEEVSFL